MGKAYRPYYPDADLLLPPSLREWLAEDHLAYFVSDVVDNLDLSAMDAVYGNEKRGHPPYDPQMMTKVLVYAYCVGVFSSRRIEQRLTEDIAFRVLAADNHPNFRTISDFRRIHLATLEGLFSQVLQIALEAGAMKVGRVALDGTKLKANASKHKAMSYDRMLEKEKALKEEVKQMLSQAEAADAEEDKRYGRNRRGDELPGELKRRESRLAKIREAKRAVQDRARARAAEEGGDPKKAKPAGKDQYNFTDPESRIMKGADGFVQAYNAQGGGRAGSSADRGSGGDAGRQRQRTVIADGRCHRAAERTKTRKDPGRQRLTARRTTCTLWRALKTLNTASKPTSPPSGRNTTITSSPRPKGPLPKNATRVDRMRRKLKTKAGKAVYAARKAIVEPVFGQIKQARGFRQFLLRGIDKVRGEWALVCLTHNVLKLHRLCNEG